VTSRVLPSGVIEILDNSIFRCKMRFRDMATEFRCYMTSKLLGWAEKSVVTVRETRRRFFFIHAAEFAQFFNYLIIWNLFIV
jgi:hypothetical protein